MTLFEDIRILCELPGVSGREEPIREYIISQLPEGVSYETDALGNLYVEKKGAKRPKNKVVLFAHMDEVGLMITYITDDGYLKFDEIGGIDPAVLIGRTVRLECGLVGVISLKALHLCEGDEDKKIPPIRELCIDIGAKDREEAEKYVALGSYAVYRSDYVEFGKSRVKMKALDDRFGCALMMDLIRSDLEYDTTFVFTVQEEVGARGAAAGAFTTTPDIAVILETTTAGDICGVEGDRRACVLGDGHREGTGHPGPDQDAGRRWQRLLVHSAHRRRQQSPRHLGPDPLPALSSGRPRPERCREHAETPEGAAAEAGGRSLRHFAFTTEDTGKEQDLE